MEFNNGAELLELCQKTGFPISQIMKKREAEFSKISEAEVEKKMRTALEIMRNSAKEPLKNPQKSMGGLIGGEAKLLENHRLSGKSICGTVLSKAMTYAMAVLEVNASMGVIVAAPTAGSSGVVPGVLFALQEEFDLSDEELLNGLYTAGAVGYLSHAKCFCIGSRGRLSGGGRSSLCNGGGSGSGNDGRKSEDVFVGSNRSPF